VHEEHGSWLAWIYDLRVGPHHLVPGWVPEAVPFAVLIALVLAVLVRLGMRRPGRVPRGLQSLVEWVFVGLENSWRGVLGEQTRRFSPFLSTLFIYILLMNWTGLLPGFKSPTANLNTTAALALVVFVMVQVVGIRENGLGYARHFAEGAAGLPVVALIVLTPLLVVIHVVGELARPLSLALRLFGNVSSEDRIVLVLVTLGSLLFTRGLGGILEAIPSVLAPLMIGMALFTGLVQAYIFAVLAAVYLAGVVHEAPREEHASA
jgi:F-type H+-transporting ATPase subunit a